MYNSDGIFNANKRNKIHIGKLQAKSSALNSDFISIPIAIELCNINWFIFRLKKIAFAIKNLSYRQIANLIQGATSWKQRNCADQLAEKRAFE